MLLLLLVSIFLNSFFIIMSGGQVVEIGSFSNVPEVVPSNFVNWRKYHLNLCYSAEQD